MMRQIDISVDVFAAIWAARLPHELNEDQILGRLLRPKHATPETGPAAPKPIVSNTFDSTASNKYNLPRSKKWTDVLLWSLDQLGGKANLSEIYRKSREGRSALGFPITAEHDASARECLESHCLESTKFRGKADLFHMPMGKGAGVWAVR
ncbi:hypothetical protein [Mesorhizobium sp. M0138]|uniref:hypothetical protein n=1 Tax=Mesorhizobium sp. M0138 TaxID=2956891 RepID=UPI00333741DB